MKKDKTMMVNLYNIINIFYLRQVAMKDRQALITATLMLIERLERISADSIWAHRASGLRGSLLRGLELVKQEGQESEIEILSAVVEQGYHLLEEAAREIPDMDSILG
jgi:hypothetical protein